MTETQKIMFAVVGVILSGFIMVGVNKQQSEEQIEAASMIRSYAAMQTMANQKCPFAIKEETGEQVFFPSATQSDKDSYITLKYQGESGKFKTASCTLHMALGGISELIIDDKVVIKKTVKQFVKKKGNPEQLFYSGRFREPKLCNVFNHNSKMSPGVPITKA